MMAIDRRQFLIRLGALAVATLPGIPLALTKAQTPAYCSSFTDVYGKHWLALLSPAGEVLSQVATPSRGHGACLSGDNTLIAGFARRPGRWLMLLNRNSGEVLARGNAPEGSHFNGHGVFSHDSTHLFVTENDYANQRGMIGVYTANTLQRVAEIGSYGIDPHELALLSDGQTLVVANGGIVTHPDFGRRKLNLASMAPNLSYIDIPSGKVLESHAPPHHQLSLRHLSVTSDDRVIIGAQYEGPAEDDRPLVFLHQRGKALRPLPGQPLSAQRNLVHYIASVTCCPKGRFALTSAPRGNRVSQWDIRKETWVTDLDLPDIGGIAVAPDSEGRVDGDAMLLSSGTGVLYGVSLPSGEAKPLLAHPKLQWDNHLRGFGV